MATQTKIMIKTPEAAQKVYSALISVSPIVKRVSSLKRESKKVPYAYYTVIMALTDPGSGRSSLTITS